MSDDLSSFFAKKAAKKDKKKKAGLVKIEDVGTALERRAQRKEELPSHREEGLNDNGEFESQKKVDEEDSEWIGYAENKVRLAEMGLKDMNLTEQVEEQMKEEQKEKAAAAAEPAKTWNVGDAVKKTEEQEEAAVQEQQPAEPVKRAYRPPGAARLGGPARSGRGAAIDIHSEDMFPTFAAAEEIEKQKTNDLKNELKQPAVKNSWSTSTRPQQVHRQAEAAPTITRNMFRALDNERSPVPAPGASEPKKGSYVPPHLRKRT
ncbi:hypothetical protein L596_023966 [Steinernema carpocapsae]|uniref:Protein CDV3 homolog n=1 Tax=Steinernema carpocapsae TaxID=34508 RepID=A0A4U5MF94_STECR|nr:hypothetical protein L596_023966 [Steinernema carpocapsae]